MSVTSLIQQYGVSVTKRRLTFGTTTTLGTKITSETTAAITMLVQVRGGSTGFKYGSERSEYDATGYVDRDVDILNADLIDYGSDRKYRVDSVRIPDERPSGDPLGYKIVGLNETRKSNGE